MKVLILLGQQMNKLIIHLDSVRGMYILMFLSLYYSIRTYLIYKIPHYILLILQRVIYLATATQQKITNLLRIQMQDMYLILSVRILLNLIKYVLSSHLSVIVLILLYTISQVLKLTMVVYFLYLLIMAISLILTLTNLKPGAGSPGLFILMEVIKCSSSRRNTNISPP